MGLLDSNTLTEKEILGLDLNQKLHLLIYNLQGAAQISHSTIYRITWFLLMMSLAIGELMAICHLFRARCCQSLPLKKGFLATQKLPRKWRTVGRQFLAGEGLFMACCKI